MDVFSEPAVDVIDARRQHPRVSSLDDLVGLDEVRGELRAVVRLWADPGALRGLGGSPRTGLLFVGPTGTGKTTAAHALAAETGRTLYAFAGPDFHDAAGKDLLATVLSVTARQPAVVFIDEADDMVRVRDGQRPGRRTHDGADSLVKHLLVGLDRTTRDIHALFVLATNVGLDEIDPALCHPGRLGRPITFRQLDTQERHALLSRHAPRFSLADDVDLASVAARLAGLPTASVAHVLDEAALVAWRRDADRIAQVDLHEAVTRLRGGLPRARALTGAELAGAAAHEAGHALATLILGESWDAVAFVSVDARAEGSLGSVTGAPEDGEIRTEDWVRRQLVIVLAGREAERLLLGVTDTGSASDLATANQLALRATRDWGFSRRGARTAEVYAESKVDARVDDAAIELIADAEQDARDLLLGHRAALERLAECLASHRQAGPRELARWLADLLPITNQGADR